MDAIVCGTFGADALWRMEVIALEKCVTQPTSAGLGLSARGLIPRASSSRAAHTAERVVAVGRGAVGGQVAGGIICVAAIGDLVGQVVAERGRRAAVELHRGAIAGNI